MTKFIIKDWADNICFNGLEFDDFEDAWGFIYEKFPDGDEDRTFDDYFVEEKDGIKRLLERVKKEGAK